MKNRFIVFISLFLILSSDCALCSNTPNQEEPDFKNITTIRQFNNPRALEIAKKYEKVLIIYSIDSIIEDTNGPLKLRDKNIPNILKNMQTTLTKEGKEVTFIIMNTNKHALQYTRMLIRTQLKGFDIDKALFANILYSYKQKNKWRSSFGEEYSEKATSKQLIAEYFQKTDTPKFDLVNCTSTNKTTAKRVQKACKTFNIPSTIYHLIYKKKPLNSKVKGQNKPPENPDSKPKSDQELMLETYPELKKGSKAKKKFKKFRSTSTMQDQTAQSILNEEFPPLYKRVPLLNETEEQTMLPAPTTSYRPQKTQEEKDFAQAMKNSLRTEDPEMQKAKILSLKEHLINSLSEKKKELETMRDQMKLTLSSLSKEQKQDVTETLTTISDQIKKTEKQILETRKELQALEKSQKIKAVSHPYAQYTKEAFEFEKQLTLLDTLMNDMETQQGNQIDPKTLKALKKIGKSIRDINKQIAMQEKQPIKPPTPPTQEDLNMEKAIINSLKTQVPLKTSMEQAIINSMETQGTLKTSQNPQEGDFPSLVDRLKALEKKKIKIDKTFGSLENQKNKNFKQKYAGLIKKIKNIRGQLKEVNKKQALEKTKEKEEKKLQEPKKTPKKAEEKKDLEKPKEKKEKKKENNGDLKQKEEKKKTIRTPQTREDIELEIVLEMSLKEKKEKEKLQEPKKAPKKEEEKKGLEQPKEKKEEKKENDDDLKQKEEEKKTIKTPQKKEEKKENVDDLNMRIAIAQSLQGTPTPTPNSQEKKDFDKRLAQTLLASLKKQKDPRNEEQKEQEEQKKQKKQEEQERQRQRQRQQEKKKEEPENNQSDSDGHNDGSSHIQISQEDTPPIKKLEDMREAFKKLKEEEKNLLQNQAKKKQIQKKISQLKAIETKSSTENSGHDLSVITSLETEIKIIEVDMAHNKKNIKKMKEECEKIKQLLPQKAKDLIDAEKERDRKDAEYLEKFSKKLKEKEEERKKEEEKEKEEETTNIEQNNNEEEGEIDFERTESDESENEGEDEEASGEEEGEDSYFE